MTQSETSRIADAWLRYWQAPTGSPARERLFWACDQVRDLLDRKPEALWQFILEVHGKDKSPVIQQVLSAGPLEDLLTAYGPIFIERIERKAIDDPSFAQLLGGVWKSRMSDEVWRRIRAVWDRRSWDGMPE